MERIIPYKLFESITDNDKYLLNISSANSIIGAESWISKSPRITDDIKAKAEKSWSLYAMLNKITRMPVRVGRLSNKEIANQIKVTGIRPMRIREEYDEVSKQLLPKFHKLINKFKSLSIERKVEFMIELEVEGYTICPNSDIIKIINKKDLEEELEVISGIFRYFLEEETNESSNYEKSEEFYKDLTDSIFFDINEYFVEVKKRFFPLLVKLAKNTDGSYYGSICMSGGWAGRMNDEEEDWLFDLIKHHRSTYGISYSACADSHGSRYFYERKNMAWPESSMDMMEFPEDPFPERID